MTLSTETRLDAEHVFKTYNEDGKEIYGWVEKNGQIVKGSSGWFRTNDVETAARIAASNMGIGQ